IQFILVGDGALKQQYIRQYEHLPNVVFAPKVNRSQVPAVLDHADIVYFSTHPSKVWDYGQSLNKLIDYMLSAKPIVASYSGFPSMINESGCGYFVPAGDVDALATQLEELAQMTPSERAAIGRKGREWLLKHRQYSVLAEDFSRAIFGDLRA